MIIFLLNRINYFKIDGEMAVFHPSINMPSEYSFSKLNISTDLKMNSGEEAIVLDEKTGKEWKVKVSVIRNKIEIIQLPTTEKLALSNIEEVAFY